MSGAEITQHVRRILEQWGNAASRDDQTIGHAIAGDVECRGREEAVAALVLLAMGRAPSPSAGSWWADTNADAPARRRLAERIESASGLADGAELFADLPERGRP